MTFSAKVKEEVASTTVNPVEARTECCAILKFDGVLVDKKIVITLENAAIARRIYKLIKEIYKVNIKIIIRNQKRFRIKQIYILEISEKFMV